MNIQWNHAIIGQKEIWVFDGAQCTATIAKHGANDYECQITHYDGKSMFFFGRATLEESMAQAALTIKELESNGS